jgi:hypothetical protein
MNKLEDAAETFEKWAVQETWGDQRTLKPGSGAMLTQQTSRGNWNGGADDRT